MKIIKVESCCECPKRIHIIDLTCNPGACSRYVCNKLNRTLALKNLEQIIKPLKVCVATQTIVPGVSKWIYSADGKTEWTGKIPEWCLLDDINKIMEEIK